MSTTEICSTFIEGAPPGELNEVVNDIKALTSDDDPSLIEKLKPAFQKYNEEQLLAVKLPGAADPVLISSHNRLTPTTYFDTLTSTSFTLDHTTQTLSSPQPYTHSTPHTPLITSIAQSLTTHFTEHYPPQPSTSSGAAFTVCASTSHPSCIAILLSTTKTSPSNFLSGRWRSSFLYDPATSTLTGQIKIQVHYYEDGNVALSTTKVLPETSVDGGGSGEAVVKRIAGIEKQYQEEVNRGFVGMNEGGFRGLRRQLPVTRMKMEWEKVRGYGLGGDLKGEGRR